MSSHELHLTYFPLRARGEPILLLLVDSGTPFTLEEVRPETWVRWKKSGDISRDVYPYSQLPVLRVRDKSVPGKVLVLAETLTILSFLEEFLAPQGTPLLRDECLEVRASAQMIQEASLFFLGRVVETSADKAWLASPKREKLWRGIVTRYLRSTEGALGKLSKSTHVVPCATESLKGYMAAVVTALNLITDMFPSAQTALGSGGEYELCGRVWRAVRGRERVAEHWRKNKVQAKPWTISDYGTAEWIAHAAKL